MANKTAMQKLIDYMRANFHLTEDTEMEFVDSQFAEKEQIEAAFNQGYREGFNDAQSVVENEKDVSEYDDAANYYNSTFDISVVS